jgi:hypothetical protein
VIPAKGPAGSRFPRRTHRKCSRLRRAMDRRSDRFTRIHSLMSGAHLSRAAVSVPNSRPFYLLMSTDARLKFGNHRRCFSVRESQLAFREHSPSRQPNSARRSACCLE